MKIRTYSELSQLATFKERFEYLKLGGAVGKETFAHERYLNQRFYHSYEWRRLRDQIIIRDLGCDLGIEGYELNDRIYIHHMNPLLIRDLVERTEFLMEPEYLICCSFNTHQAIHYGDASLLVTEPVQRIANDTCPWRQTGG